MTRTVGYIEIESFGSFRAINPQPDWRSIPEPVSKEIGGIIIKNRKALHTPSNLRRATMP